MTNSPLDNAYYFVEVDFRALVFLLGIFACGLVFWIMRGRSRNKNDRGKRHHT